MSSSSRWEVGSAFPLGLPAVGTPIDVLDGWRLFGSGRQALAALLAFGRLRFGWTRVHVPTYYCPEVVAAISDVLPMKRYTAAPTVDGEPPDVRPGEVVIGVSYFGASPLARARSESALIIDSTHDPLAPWLREIEADYVFASLRKTLPLPDGGAVWSNSRRELPPEVPPTDQHMAAVGRILSAMSLKAAYLDGACFDKDLYLSLFASGEERLRSGYVSGISDYSRGALRILPAWELRRRRIDNAAILAAGLASLDGVTVHARTFGVILECDSTDLREVVRRGLIERKVYPAILWNQLSGTDEVGGRACFSRRMLFLHTDFRWHRQDMERVAAVVRRVVGHSRNALVDKRLSAGAASPTLAPHVAVSPC